MHGHYQVGYIEIKLAMLLAQGSGRAQLQQQRHG